MLRWGGVSAVSSKPLHGQHTNTGTPVEGIPVQAPSEASSPMRRGQVQCETGLVQEGQNKTT
eukprot:scaffold23796_cov144-Isochrysis_galbana.AAC.2